MIGLGLGEELVQRPSGAGENRCVTLINRSPLANVQSPSVAQLADNISSLKATKSSAAPIVAILFPTGTSFLNVGLTEITV